LPAFKPDQFNLYHELFHQDWQKMHCKMGMTGNIAVSHFDAARNTIVLLQGRKRYLLADPSQCPKYQLHADGHPSSRHTRFDWTDLMTRGDDDDDDDNNSDSQEQQVQMNEVVLQLGDALILPTYWFHSIIGLTHENAQCNVWSAATVTYKATIQACTDGFEQETQLLSATGQAIPS
jgi:hypothetical protein